MPRTETRTLADAVLEVMKSQLAIARAYVELTKQIDLLRKALRTNKRIHR